MTDDELIPEQAPEQEAVITDEQLEEVAGGNTSIDTVQCQTLGTSVFAL